MFYFAEIRDLFHMKLFVDTDPDTRLARRGELKCDANELCLYGSNAYSCLS